MCDEGTSGIVDINYVETDLENCISSRNENFLEETVPGFSDAVFMKHFRLNRDIAYNLSSRYGNSKYFCQQKGKHGLISAEHQVLIFLWYLGHQLASFRDIAEKFEVTISSVHRIIRRVGLHFSSLSEEFIRWPKDGEKRDSEAYFRGQGFTNVIGVIGATQIRIDKPSVKPEFYSNNKGYYSIKMQAVCNHRSQFIDVFIGYPGSIDDGAMFRDSPLQKNLSTRCGGYFILGDISYPLRENLIIPYKEPENLTERQTAFNIKLSKSHDLIHRAFIVLKQKFRQLNHLKLRDIKVINHLLRAACVLHNISINEGGRINHSIDDLSELLEKDKSQSEDSNKESITILKEDIDDRLEEMEICFDSE